MRFDRIRIRSLGPFREVDLDIAALPGRLVSVQGSNGQGKSCLLELLAGALLRECPTRGSLRELATARDAFVEVELVNGARWTVRQTIDAVSGKGEALILAADGRPVLDDGKVSTADRWIAEHLVCPETLFASAFSVQGREGFTSMKPAERKACLIRLLGVERLEVLADAARTRARDAKQQLAIIEARAEDERHRADVVESMRSGLLLARAAASKAAEELTAARAQLELARAAEATLKQREAIETRIAGHQARADKLRRMLDGADAIRLAVAALPEHRAALAAAETKARELDAQTREAQAELRRLRSEWERARQSEAEAARRIERADEVLSQRAAVEAAVEALPATRAEVERLRAELATVEGDLGRLHEQRIAGADDRIGLLRGALIPIAEGAEHPSEIALAALTVDDESVREAVRHPEYVLQLEAVTHRVRVELRAEEEHVRRMELVAAHAGEMARAAEDRAAAELARDTATAEAKRLRAEGETAAARAKELLDAAAAANLATGPLDARVRETEPLAARADELAGAEAQLAEIECVVGELRAELDALPEVETGRLGKNWPAIVGEAERTHRDAERSVTRTEAALAVAIAATARLAELDVERRAVETHLADWNVLARDLGRDGVQAALIDAAGPELTETANSLLRDCHGSRFTIVIETTRASADGKRQLEGLDVRVIDTEHGGDRAIETYSGGERVILGEAISLALTSMMCRRSGAERPTVVRDESGAALDPENARAYVAMLRRAAEMIDARVLLVSHSPEVQELADCTVIVRDGGVEVLS